MSHDPAIGTDFETQLLCHLLLVAQCEAHQDTASQLAVAPGGKVAAKDNP